MLPDSVLSSTTLSGAFRYPRNRRRSAFLDYELGGIGLNDPSAGLEYQVWRGRYIDTNIVLDAPNTPPTVVYTRVGLHEFGFTFDQNMNPFIVFMDDFGSFFYWFDTTIADYRLSQLPFGSVNPRCCLDDKREMQTGASDIILAYTRNDSLYFRAQRDRYETEYELTSALPRIGVLDQIGMNEVWRFQFGFREGERITPEAVPLILYGVLPDSMEDEEYSALLQGFGGILPYTFSVSSGSLPTGLLLDSSTGVLSGTPTTPGTYTFTVRVTDGNSDIAEREFEIDIVEALSVTGTLSSPATVNDEYSSSLVASGGIEPYTWSIVDGELPDGLTLDTETGVISGTPTVEGTFNFTLRVTDSEGNFVDSPQSVLIAEAADSIDLFWDDVVLLVDASPRSDATDEHWDDVVLLVDGSL